MDIDLLKLADATVIDVRSEAEFATGHYPGAINIPLDDILDRIDEFVRINTPIVVYCRTGNRSIIAAELLKAQGIPGVQNGRGLREMGLL